MTKPAFAKSTSTRISSKECNTNKTYPKISICTAPRRKNAFLQNIDYNSTGISLAKPPFQHFDDRTAFSPVLSSSPHSPCMQTGYRHHKAQSWIYDLPNTTEYGCKASVDV